MTHKSSGEEGLCREKMQVGASDLPPVYGHCNHGIILPHIEN